MRALIVLLIIVALPLMGCQQKFEGKVIKVVDGDTIVVDLNGKLERVRLIGVDTPEIVPEGNRPYEYDNITNLTLLSLWGLKAKEFAESYLDHRIVILETDTLAGYRDKYGRLLAYVYVNGTDFNALLLEKGYARVYVTKFKKLEHYLKIQEMAMREKRGIWRYAS